MCATSNPENDDWMATCEIFDASRQSTVEYPDGFGGSICAIDVPIRVKNTVFIRKASNGGGAYDVDPRFVYDVLTSCKAPVFRVQFHYASSSFLLKSVSVSSLDYPEPWPREAMQSWVKWLNQKTSKVLCESSISFAVCEFIEYEGLTFFDEICIHETEGFAAVVCNKYPLGNSVASQSTTTVGHLRIVAGVHQVRGISNPNISMDDFAKHVIFSHWKQWVKIECPICFSEITVTEAVEITCKHFLCAQCMTMYAKAQVEEIHTFRTNPFKCPLPSCKRDMEVIGCVKMFLTEDEMEEVRLWDKNLKHPLSTTLQSCPRRRCSKGPMRRAEDGSHMVFCDVCGITWCELCLSKYVDCHDDCDPTLALQLCKRYRHASDQVKALCEKKWPWIREYSAARMEDETVLKWVRENASRCPRCHNGIERSEGCFHMQCSHCATHFCYECGEELEPPYYGTHHCWENQNDIVNEHGFEFDGD